MPTNQANSTGSLSSLRILLVEDHVDTRDMMARLLRLLGCQVTSVGSVADALSAAGTHQFDLLLSDIGLPDGTGFDVMQNLRDQHVHGIALSGYGYDEDIARSHDAGFEMHLTKPVNIEVLREAIQKLAG
jgi:CheY-like chemotaxis protein